MKKPAKGLSAALCALAAVMLAVVLLMTSVRLTGLNKNYFMRSHEKLGTAERIGVSDADLEMITENLVDYLKGKREDLDMQAQIALRGNEREVFTEVEKLHMVDVYWMFRAGYVARDWCLLIFAAALIAAFFLAKDGFAKRCAKTMLITCLVCVVVLGAVSLWVAAGDFTEIFFAWHEVAFDNDMWLLSYEEHVLVNMVPEAYFSTIARDITLIFGAGILAVCAACIVVLVRSRKKVADAV